jgi:predicted HicB family RNase H-like nuclease
MKESRRKPNVSIRIDPEVLHKAKIQAVIEKKTLGEWLEEAIRVKIERSDRDGHKQDKG